MADGVCCALDRHDVWVGRRSRIGKITGSRASEGKGESINVEREAEYDGEQGAHEHRGPGGDAGAGENGESHVGRPRAHAGPLAVLVGVWKKVVRSSYVVVHSRVRAPAARACLRVRSLKLALLRHSRIM